MKAFVTVILARWDLIRKWNALVLPCLGSLSPPLISSGVVRYVVFLGKWDFLSVDIMYCWSVHV